MKLKHFVYHCLLVLCYSCLHPHLFDSILLRERDEIKALDFWDRLPYHDCRGDRRDGFRRLDEQKQRKRKQQQQRYGWQFHVGVYFDKGKGILDSRAGLGYLFASLRRASIGSCLEGIRRVKGCMPRLKHNEIIFT